MNCQDCTIFSVRYVRFVYIKASAFKTLRCSNPRPDCNMDSRSISTASTYINNLLLSRGLLRNGTPIDFATQDKAATDGEATMVKIMNLVHDLILRRDV